MTRLLCLASLLLTTLMLVYAQAPLTIKGTFVSVPGAHDCAYDAQRKQLYVTTSDKLVVLDADKGTTVKEYPLPGDLLACDVSPDCQYLAVTALTGQYFYWIKLADMSVNQVRFANEDFETGTFGVTIGYDNTVLFDMTCSGSGFVRLLTFDPVTEKVTPFDDTVDMNSVITPSADRKFAIIADGECHPASIHLYDFAKKDLSTLFDIDADLYEVACSRDVKLVAHPCETGCEVYDADGKLVKTLDGAPALAAAFAPQVNDLFLMRNGSNAVEECDPLTGKKVASYAVNEPFQLMVKEETAPGTEVLLAWVRPGVYSLTEMQTVYRSIPPFTSGRVKVSDDGNKLVAVIPTGVYLFDIPAHTPPANDSGQPKINVIVGSGGN